MERVRFRAVQLLKSRDALTPAGGPFRHYAPEGSLSLASKDASPRRQGLRSRPNSLSGLIVEGRVL